MTDAMAVAVHWPFVRKNLFLGRARPARIALDLLAELQFRATGELVRLGRARLRRECGLMAGEAGAVYNALCELERRGVVTRLRDAGNRAHAWGFRGDVRRWRAMPWTGSGRDVETAVSRCICSTDRAFAARNPGQGLSGAPHFWLADADHLYPPGLFLVDSRGKRAPRAANARRPGATPVDSRGSCAAPSPAVLSSLEDLRLQRRTNVDERVDLMLRAGVRHVCGGASVWPRSDAERSLLELASVISPEQAAACVEGLRDYRVNGQHVKSPPFAVQVLWDLAASPAITALS